jgi:hypothetical protein
MKFQLIRNLSVASTIVFSLVAGEPLDRKVAAVPLPVIRCHLEVANPHKSGHVPGTINVVGTLSCKGVNAASMAVTVGLGKTVCTPNCRTVNVGTIKTNSATYKPKVQANSSVSCSPGKYFGTAVGYVIAPPRVNPPTAHLEAVSKTVQITCSNQRRNYL